MRRGRARGSLCVAVSLALAPLLPARVDAANSSEPRAARADSAVSPGAAARRLVLEGDELYAKRSYAQALERYAEAYRIMHVPTVGVEVVKAQKALGKLLEATQTAREVSGSAKQPGEPAVFDQARLQAARDVVALSGLTPSLLLEVAPRGVPFAVQIDGVPPGRETPFPVNPGAHHLRVSADGYQNVEIDVTLQEAERQTLSVTLYPQPAVSAAAVSAAPVAAAAAANTAAAPPASQPAPARSPEPDEGPGSGRTLGWVGIGVAGVGLAAGTFAGIRALQTKPDCPNDVCSPTQREDIQTSKQMGYIADVSFGVAIVAGALGIWALVSSSGGDDPETTPLPAALRDQGAGRVLAGSGESDLAVTSIELGTGPVQLRVSGSF